MEMIHIFTETSHILTEMNHIFTEMIHIFTEAIRNSFVETQSIIYLSIRDVNDSE
jgi:hypothetical protein